MFSAALNWLSYHTLEASLLTLILSTAAALSIETVLGGLGI